MRSSFLRLDEFDERQDLAVPQHALEGGHDALIALANLRLGLQHGLADVVLVDQDGLAVGSFGAARPKMPLKLGPWPRVPSSEWQVAQPRLS